MMKSFATPDDCSAAKINATPSFMSPIKDNGDDDAFYTKLTHKFEVAPEPQGEANATKAATPTTPNNSW